MYKINKIIITPARMICFLIVTYLMSLLTFVIVHREIVVI